MEQPYRALRYRRDFCPPTPGVGRREPFLAARRGATGSKGEHKVTRGGVTAQEKASQEVAHGQTCLLHNATARNEGQGILAVLAARSWPDRAAHSRAPAAGAEHPVRHPADRRPPSFDGMAELWFDDLDALQAARRTPEWRMSTDDEANFIDETRTALFLSQEHEIPG